MREPVIARKPARVLVGVEFNPESDGWHLVPSAFYQLCRMVHLVPHVVEPRVVYGAIRLATGPRPDRYLAAIEVSQVGELPAGLVAGSIPEGLYAVFTVDGSLNAIVDAYAFINETWMPGSGYREARCGATEVYDHRFAPSGDCQFEIWVSVEPTGDEAPRPAE
jgi:AraC family transcriptional regulator